MGMIESGSHQAAQAVTAGIAAGAYTGLVLYNPLTSGVARLRPKLASVVPTVAPLSASALAIAGGYADSAPTLAGQITVVSHGSLKDLSASVGKLYTGITIPAAGGVSPRVTQYLFPLAFVGTALPGLVSPVGIDLSGLPALEPGAWILIAATVAMTYWCGLAWEVDG